MQPRLLSNGLNEIYENYDAFFIDLWGVIHNGVQLIESANDVLDHLKKKKEEICFNVKCSETQNQCSKVFKIFRF